MMPDNLRFLLGKGEKLTSLVDVAKGGGEKKHPYTFGEAKRALLPLFEIAAEQVRAISERACPGGQAVAAITLHPAYLAKSYYPATLLQTAELTAIGSRARAITPRNESEKSKRTAGSDDTSSRTTTTTQLYVAGTRKSIESLPSRLRQVQEGTTLASDIVKVEDLRVPQADDRIRVAPPKAPERDQEVLLEAVLHTGRGKRMQQLVLDGFEAYLGDLNLRADFDRKFETDSLCFLPVRAPRPQVREVAEFTFLRVLREMPSLRQFRPFFRDVPGMEALKVELPSSGAIDPTIVAAIFDGGLPKAHGFDPWVASHDAAGIGAPVAEFMRHGMAVTSAFLFGPLDEDQPAGRPPCKVDHYRVLDDVSGKDPQGELYDVLRRIDDVLNSKPYPLVGLSIGPDLPIEDDDPSAWTTILDLHFRNGKTLASVAVGNNGEADRASGNHRIQPPSDCVNAMGVGASDSRGEKWKRASYSCMGPGRCPGYIKPDLLAFGGSRKEPFWVLDSQKPGHASAITGTSFAAPTALRVGALTRAHFGDVLTPLATKALLVHSARQDGLPREEVGWGRIPENVMNLMTCGDGEVRVLYQDVLSPTRWMRAPIPVPDGLAGMVQITATICYATEIDPQDPINYTRSGLEVSFRPKAGKMSRKDQVHADTKPFFSMKLFGSPEQELRAEAHKWETTMHSFASLRATSIKDPVFDIHYVAREEGHATVSATKIPYALVVTVRAPKVKDLFEQTHKRYPILKPLRPIIEVPIRV